MRLAALPMYDLPELAAATDALWSGIARRLRADGVVGVPDRLDRSREARAIWSDPDLLFSQTCGFPLTHAFAGRMAVVATPCYAAPGCTGPNYRSFIVARAEDARTRLADFAGARAAINSPDSHSGCNILRWRIAQETARPFFGSVRETGSHAQSLAVVKAGQADLAAVDCVTYALLGKHRPEAIAGIKIVDETALAPGLPYVTSPSTDETTLAALRRALAEAIADPALAKARNALLLAGVEELPLTRYQAIRDYAGQGADLT